MSQPMFEMINGILDIWKIVIQAVMFLVLWAVAFREKKSKRDGIAAALFILGNIGIGFLPCAGWVRYGVSAFVIMVYAGIFYKKQIGKAIFVILAFYNLHCLSFLIVNSIYMKIMSVMMKSLDATQESYLQRVYQCQSIGMAVFVFFYTVLFVAMTVIFHRLIKGEAVMALQDVILLSILNFVGSMIANVVNGLLIVRIDTDVFVLFDEKPDLIWKIPMIAVLIFAGGDRIDLFLAEIPHPACCKTETFCGGAASEGHEETLGGSGEFLWKHSEGAPRDEEPYGEH